MTLTSAHPGTKPNPRERSETARRGGKPRTIEDPADLGRRTWDVVVVGAGHNGLTCATYLAQAGLSVLVLEARSRVGGACTIQEVWPGYHLSPCAYLAGLLHPVVIEELGLPARGFRWHPATSGMFVPFEDGNSIQLWEDDDRCRAEIARIAPKDLDGWDAMIDVKRRLRDAIRPDGPGDLWLDPEPRREEIERRLRGDDEARRLLFEWSMAEFLGHYLESPYLRVGLLGQGIIGTNASPFDPGTASIHFHHASGRLGGLAGTWGYVEGGMAMVSYLISDAALEAGAVVMVDTPVGAIEPGSGVRLEDGRRIDARAVVGNLDPGSALGLLGDQVDSAWAARVRGIPRIGCTVKLNVALRRRPSFKARPGDDMPHHYGQINTPLSEDQWREGFEAARDGRLPDRLWTELYFQTSYDSSVAPEGHHAMSVFAQYVPQRFAEGTWNSRREEVGDLALRSIAAHCEDLDEVVVDAEVLGPPDIAERVGLSGGHIFQGECLPEFMWDRRLSARTPMSGFYLCGAGTHPGGSVIGVNGRNAATLLLRDLRAKAAPRHN